ncbi:MAG TPA: M13 family metallopeptidase [Woeseiaceae bacterium]|nr:M13 family metallopeptidase [Woeseiaceae bacterium]
MKRTLGYLACGLLLIATGYKETANEANTGTTVGVTPARAADKVPALGAWGVDLRNMDTSVRPGNDFFSYVNGHWLNTFVIPADFTNYGSFTELFELSEDRVGSIVRDAVANAEAQGLERKIADYYSAFIDVAGINANGLAAAKADFAYYDNLKTHADVAAAMARPDLASNAPIQAYVYVDEKRPDRYAVYLTQAGLGMPTREYYLEDQFKEQKTKYAETVDTLLTLAGAKTLGDAGSEISDLETRIAEIHWTPAEQRDRDKTYNPVKGDALQSELPGFPWEAYFAAAEVGGQAEYIVNELSAVEKLAVLFEETPVEIWREYLKFHYIVAHAAVLSQAIDDAQFAFFGQTLQGQELQRPRIKRAIAAVNGALGEAVGEIYVERYFPPEAKAAMSDLIDNVIAAFHTRIENLDWMSAETKKEALEKLAKFRPYIAGPEKWRDYSTLQVSATDALANTRQANISNWRYLVARLGKPIDPANEWSLTPQTVNAYYSPPRNAIYFPAAILQPPFFDPYADPAVNYGGIAAVIGHEIGHGFDDEGRKSDGDGALRNWWTDEDARRFEARTTVLGAQFASYSPIEGMYVNPDLTMGENVGDLGGVNVAYHAYRMSLDGKEAPVLDGYSGDQRFFLAYGQVWKRLHRLENLKMRLVADPHSPAEYRVNGIVRNMDAWYDAFDVKPGDALYLPPAERVQIW